MYPNGLKKAATLEWYELDGVRLHSAKIAATTIKISLCTQIGTRSQLHNDDLCSTLSVIILLKSTQPPLRFIHVPKWVKESSYTRMVRVGWGPSSFC